jgi:predicted histone-like DNA-binding protein
MARYIKKEIVDLNGTGKKQAYYRMQTWRKLDHEEFVKKCTYVGSGVSRAMMDAVLTVVADELPRLLAMGYSVRIDGLGTFNAKLGVRKDKEQDAFEEGEQKRNAQSIEVNGIGFRADKELISKTDRECDLERGGVSRLKVSKYSLEERIVLAKKYLENHVMMRVGDYATLTGLSHSKASIELRELCERPDAGFKAQGRGSHRVYIKRDE